jgi:hypothetical protein
MTGIERTFYFISDSMKVPYKPMAHALLSLWVRMVANLFWCLFFLFHKPGAPDKFTHGKRHGLYLRQHKKFFLCFRSRFLHLP